MEFKLIMKLLFLICSILFFVLVIFAGFYLSNSNKNTEYSDQKQNIEEIKKIPSSNLSQYSDTTKIHFDHMPIIYYFSDSVLLDKKDRKKCPEHQARRLKNAFAEIEKLTNGMVYFQEYENQGDIAINCYGTAIADSVHTLSGEGGRTLKGNIIIKGELNFYVHRNCGNYPDLELHEILHVLGFDHVDDKNSIMYPKQVKCDGKIDDSITKELIKIYTK